MRIDRLGSKEETLLLEVRVPVRRFLKRLLTEHSAAEDAESETMLTVIQRLRAGLEIRRPISFALQVAWTKALEVQRRAARDLHIPAPRPAPVSDPARMAELKDWLESGLAALEPVDRALLHLRYVEDLSYRELARVLDEPIGTIGRRLHEARHALKSRLEKSGGKSVSESTLAAVLPLLRSLDGSPLPPVRPSLPRWTGAASRYTTAQKAVLGLGVFLVVGGGAWLLVRSGDLAQPLRAAPESPGASTPRLVADTAREAEPPREVTPSSPALAIAGRVVDDAGRGVPGATVRWRPSANGATAPGADAGHVTAGGDGAFQIQPPADQTLVDLGAAAPGFAETMRDDVRVGVADVLLRLGPGLAFHGVIANLQGDPIGDATVTYHARIGDHPVKVTTRSARDGRYAFEHLPVDPIRRRTDAGVIDVMADGYATQIKPIGMAAPGAAGGPLELDVWLARGTVLEGTVRDASGAPIPNATVEVWMNALLEVPTRPGYPVPPADPMEPRRIRETKTGPAGRYRLDQMPVRIAGIEPGSRYGPLLRRERPHFAGGLVVSAPGYAPQGATIPLASDEEAVVTVDVQVQREVVLTGSVRDARGSPVEGATVDAHLETDDLGQWVTATDRLRGRKALAATTTNELGDWVLAGMPQVAPPGRIVIAASAPGHAMTRLPLAGMRESARLPDALVLNEARKLRGVVVDERGAAVPGAVIRIVEVPPPDGAWREAIGGTATDRDGAFEIAAPAASGGLELRVTATGFGQSRVRVPEDSADEGLRIALVGERVLRGTVRSAEGRPVPGALVAAVPAALPSGALTQQHCESNPSLVLAETVSDAAGAFTLEGLPPERVALWAGVPWPRNDALLGLLFGRKFAVVVPEPAAPGPVVVTLPSYVTERGSLAVRVVDPASKAPVLHDLTGSLVAADGMIGGTGMFTGPGLLFFDAVPAGAYRLNVEAKDRPRVTKDDVKIGDPASPTEISVELSGGARLVGRVRHEGVLPPGAIVLRAIPESKDLASVRVTCREDGRFDVGGLAAGSWRVWAELQEPERPAVMTTKPVDVALSPANAPPPLELRLLPIERVTVRISGLFTEGEPPKIDKKSPRYGDLVRRLGEFRIRCRDDANVPWIDCAFDGVPFETADRDVILHLPLPSGTYALAIDHGDDEIESRRLSSPGTAEITVPAN